MMPTRTELPTQFGRYVIVKKIGEGGMGAVYLAEDTQLQRRIALKVPHFHAEDDPSIIERFQREARVAAAIEHPSICPVYDIGAIDGIHYLTMPFIEGIPLSRKVKPDDPLLPREAARLVFRLALAIQTMHQRGVIHRDLKPGNILLRPGGEPMVMDFGLARSLSGTDRLTATGATVGTPAYMAPEQLRGQQEELGPGTDVYSLGVILFELLTGRVPFTGSLHAVYNQILHAEPPPPSRFRSGIDPELDAICLKAMAKESAGRHASMTEFAMALSKFGGYEEATLAPVPNTVAPTRTEQEFAGATTPTETLPGTDRTAVPPTRVSEVTSSSRKKNRFSLRSALLATSAAVVGAGILLAVLYTQGFFERPAIQQEESEEKLIERIRDSVTPHARKDPRQVDTWQGKPRHNYHLWIEAPADVMGQIDKVVYDFDRRLFDPARRESTERDNKFETVYKGTGAVDGDMDITLMLHDGKQIILKFNAWKSLEK